MALKSLETFFFEKNLVLHIFAFCFPFFFCLLPCFINDRSPNTLSVVAESAIEHILMAILWLYDFESVFCQVLFDFLFVVCMFFLQPRKKLNTGSS